MPNKFQKNVKSWGELNPAYQIMFWDELKLHHLVEEHFPQYVKNWRKSTHFIEQIDLAKFIILWVYGGLYIDTDIIPVRPFPDGFLGYDFITTQLYIDDVCPDTTCIASILFSLGYSKKELYNNGFFGALPGSKIVLEMLQEAMKLRDIVPRFLGNLYLLSTAGPIFLTIFVKERQLEKDPRVLILPPSVMEPCGAAHLFDQGEKSCCIDKSTVGIHQHRLSWATPWYVFVLKCFYYRAEIYRWIFWVGVFVVSFLLLLWLYS